MNDKPKVSVIVLTYNHEKYIKQALESILMQQVDFDYEILIGDDCSTDHTPEILKEYQARYPEKIYLRLRHKNIGATKNAYELLMLARGDYLATCEGDDYWTNANKLQLQVDFLENNTQFIGCTHKFLIVDENGKKIKNQSLNWVKQKEVFTFEDFEGLYLPGQPSTFVRRNIFKDSEEDFSLLHHSHYAISDRTAMLIYLLKGNFYCFSGNMGAYRKIEKISGQNLTSRIYVKRDWHLEDYQLTQSLEEYASNFFKEKCFFYRGEACFI